jgi:hypothetical protein
MHLKQKVESDCTHQTGEYVLKGSNTNLFSLIFLLFLGENDRNCLLAGPRVYIFKVSDRKDRTVRCSLRLFCSENGAKYRRFDTGNKFAQRAA